MSHYMNREDIRQAVFWAAKVRDPQSREVLILATRLLQELQELTDSVSDGWPYWSPPSKAAQLLQALINDGLKSTRCPWEGRDVEVSMARLRTACAPIRRFLKRYRSQLQGAWLKFPT